MDDIFCTSFPCYNVVLKKRRQGSRAGAFGFFNPRLALARRLGQAVIFFRWLICILAAGFRDWLRHLSEWLTLRRLTPPAGSTPITSPDQCQWPSQHSKRVPVSSRAREADKRFLLLPSAIACILLCLALPTESRVLLGPAILDASHSKVVAALGGLPRGRRPAEPLLLTRHACNDIFFSGIVVCAPAAGDYTIACTPKFEKIIVVASGAIIPCGSHTWWKLSWAKSLSWPEETFRLNPSALGQPIDKGHSWVADVTIRPMKQRKPDTCALVACTLAVEAKYRFVYGEPFRWSAAEPEHLRRACKRSRIWRKGEGASIENVLEKIKWLGGVPVVQSNSARLQLHSWVEHDLDNYDLNGVAELLHHGPCVARLWMCPWYGLFDADHHNGSWVYRGCGRSQAHMDECQSLYGKKVRFHAVVCFGYRRCGDQMHVLVLDNHKDTGPWRWVDVEELHAIYTLNLDPRDYYECPLLESNDYVAYSGNDQFIKRPRSYTV